MITKFNDNFSFLLMEKGSCFADFREKLNKAKPVNIPHDWAIADVDLFYADHVGAYVKNFEYNKSERDYSRAFIRFDGVYMDSHIYLNGTLIGEWKYGYTSFVLDMTDALIDGTNELIVLVDYNCPNSRWYSGAGIYRDVYLIETGDVYIPDGGIYIHPYQDDTSSDWKMNIEIDLVGAITNTKCDVSLGIEQLGSDTKSKKTELEILSKKIDADKITMECQVRGVKLWSVDAPNCYEISIDLQGTSASGEVVILQNEKVVTGFRTTTFTTDKGFFLNGRHMKLNGVCEHHDFGSLGACFYPEALCRKIDVLKQMGVNAIRTSHNPAPPDFYKMCDLKGMMVLSEAFDMWEEPKTTYDYARFFGEWHERDVERWIVDARNHPSVIMWSIGNEIHDTHSGERGREVANELCKLVRRYDFMENAKVSFGSNYMPWENTQIVADDIKFPGYNYAENLYVKHHAEHPDWIIYGSETASIVYSRGVYHFPLAAGILSDDDCQCSALGNSTTSWGAKSIEACAGYDKECEFSLGQFLWTGFDYLGEPTPYHTKNSYFGQIDTAGFPKDPYYIWQAAWTDASVNPMVHVFPYWNFNIGQHIDIRVCTNGHHVELLVNGVSQGIKTLNVGIADYSVVYEPGEITAIAYDENNSEIARSSRHSFGETADFEVVAKEYGDVIFYEITALDKDGYVVENACDRLAIKVTGGTLLGLDNGDSTDYDSYKADSRKLFRGKLLAIVAKDHDVSTSIQVEKVTDYEYVREIVLSVDDVQNIPSEKMCSLDENRKNITLNAKILPETATCKKLDFRVTDIHGNDTSIVSVRTNQKENGEYEIFLEGLGDGDFIIRATTNDGYEYVKVISQLEFNISGLGQIYTDPYSFVPGSTYSRSIGDVDNGNERGISTSREHPTVVIFDDVDFGKYGTRKINIPVFALTDDEYSIRIYKGVPGENGAKLLCDGIYQKPSIWNTYQAEDFELNEPLTGVQTISIRTEFKVHIKGFVCEQINPVYESMWAGDASNVYGDQFSVNGQIIEHIGNNVTVDYGEFDFGENISKVTIYGHAHNGTNTLHIRLFKDDTEVRQAVEFTATEGMSEQEFAIDGICGKGQFSVVFLPGCDFDLGWIKFGE